VNNPRNHGKKQPIDDRALQNPVHSDKELTEVALAWDRLPVAIRRAILCLVTTSLGQEEPQPDPLRTSGQ
jgi:hypothetical protein